MSKSMTGVGHGLASAKNKQSGSNPHFKTQTTKNKSSRSSKVEDEDNYSDEFESVSQSKNSIKLSKRGEKV